MWQLLVPLVLLANETSWLGPILARIHNEKNYDTIILVRHSQQDFHDRVWENFLQPILNTNEEMDLHLKGSLNSESLVLVWQTGDPNLDSELWQALDRSLLNMRQVRILLVRKWEEKPPQDVSENAAYLRFLNVAAITRENRIYRMQPYAPESWVEVSPSHEHIFKKITKFYGRYMLTLPDQFAPRSVVYRNPKTGELEMTGYVYKFLKEFNRFYNFTFRWQRAIEVGERMSLILLRNMTMNATISLPISLCGWEGSTQFGVFSDIFALDQWLMVVPCAQEIPTADVYLVVCGEKFLLVLVIFYCIFTILDSLFGPLLLQKRVDWSNLLLNERMISGIMGQSYNMRAKNTVSSRVTNATLFFLGLVLSSLYAAHLKTLLTKRPTAHQISTFEDLRDSSVSVYFDEAEHFYLKLFLGNGFPSDPVQSRISYVSTLQLRELINSMNRSVAFSSLISEWLIMAKKQEFYRQPVFCFEPEMLVVKGNIWLSFPMQANSIYEEPLNEMIHRTQAAGLVGYWKQETLREMVNLGLIPQEDPFPYAAFREFKVSDLAWIWILLGICLLLACLIFLCELMVNCFVENRKLRAPAKCFVP
ncbi:hypothetical protein KR009_008036 [Drosophila setifemur]|nr:hypothetical protein KR009_008036 [Drosophila setifemur]